MSWPNISCHVPKWTCNLKPMLSVKDVYCRFVQYIFFPAVQPTRALASCIAMCNMLSILCTPESKPQAVVIFCGRDDVPKTYGKAEEQAIWSWSNWKFCGNLWKCDIIVFLRQFLHLFWQEAIELSNGGALLLTTSRWALNFKGIMAAGWPRLEVLYSLVAARVLGRGSALSSCMFVAEFATKSLWQTALCLCKKDLSWQHFGDLPVAAVGPLLRRTLFAIASVSRWLAGTLWLLDLRDLVWRLFEEGFN